MGKFIYHARTAAGEKVKGTVEAHDRKAAVYKVRKIGYTPIEIMEDDGIERGNTLSAFVSRVRSRVRSEELLMFYMQLHDMMNAGINILVSLESIAEQVQNKKFKRALEDVAERISKGSSFSDALEAHNDIFPDVFVSIVRSGEASGKLEVVLGSYVLLYEAQIELRRKIAGALLYPAILLCVGAVVILFLVIFIIPKFVTIFADAGIALPLPTRILYLMGLVMTRYWYAVIAVIVLACLGIRRYVRTDAGRLRLDTLKLSLPVIGALNRDVALTRFSTTLGMLLRSGVSIIKSLELTRGVIQNVVLESTFTGLVNGIEKGESMSVILKADGKLPAAMIQMIAVGEETGNLDGMLEKAGAFYNKAIENTIKKLAIVIEPAFLVILGTAVGFIMASILLPLFKMVNIVNI